MALKSDGTVWAWGNNSYGDLGNGTFTDSYTPVQVSGLTGVVAIAGGSGGLDLGHSLALKSDGTVWAWGYNFYGELGSATLPYSTTPVAVRGLTGVVAIAAGGFDSLALKTNSTPPPTPVINSSPANPTNQTSATFGFSDTQAGVTFLCSLDAGPFSACGSPQTYPGPLPQGSHSFAVEAKDGVGNLSTAASINWTIDTTTPTISGLAAPPANGYGWNKTSVTVSFTCNLSVALPGVSISSCSPSTILAAQGAGQSVTGTAIDNAGNTAQIKVTVNIDETNPVVSYTGGGTYTVDQTVTITCTATDALSGIATTTCPSGPVVTGPAYSFTLGKTYNYSATATDKAGNVGNGFTSFTVTVTSASLINLVNNWETNPGVAATMVATLQGAQAAFAGGNVESGDNQLSAFINQVSAQSGKSLTTTQAALLIQDAMALMK